MLEALADPNVWIALVSLIALEVVLGVDNIVFISILAGKLPEEKQDQARIIGLVLAMIMRILLLFSINWLIGLEEPITTIAGFELSGRDIILAIGGLFLIGKATFEIHENLEGETGHASAKVAPSMGAVIGQIVLLDAVFSIDSVLTAVGMADDVWVMVVAVIIAITIMIAASGPIADFVKEHPTIKILALSFLIMIGMTLVVEALHVHIPKGYIYAAMGFSIFVEMLQLRMQANREPVKLNQRHADDKTKEAKASTG
jgi:predicted tellurium resistance membrane protein TerC